MRGCQSEDKERLRLYIYIYIYSAMITRRKTGR